MDNSSAPALVLRNVSKHYGGLRALHEVSFSVDPGTVVGLVGDNGAGKSTLMRLVAGAERPSSGEIEVGGGVRAFASPSDAAKAGISVVYQDLALALQRDVVANVFLGRELLVHGRIGHWLGWLDRPAMKKEVAAALADLHTRIANVSAQCRDLSGGQRQALAIARAVMWCERLLLLDEPTSALGVEQQHEVLDVIRRVRDRGIAVVLVSHQMLDVASVCDRAVVLRQGKVVGRLERNELSMDNLVAHITGARSSVPTDSPERGREQP
jgi:simple sugar transport system ATP-binding protein